MRAATIEIDAVTGAGGFILPGDRVDVILTATFDLGAQAAADDGGPLRSRTVSETILDNVRVLAIDQSIDDLDGKPRVASTVTVELMPKQVEVVEVARQLGRISLALISVAQPTESITREDAFTQDIEISQFLSGKSSSGRRLKAEIDRRQTLERALAISREETRQLTKTYRAVLERARQDRERNASALEQALKQAREEGQRNVLELEEALKQAREQGALGTKTLEEQLKRARGAQSTGRRAPEAAPLKIYRGLNLQVSNQ